MAGFSVFTRIIGEDRASEIFRRVAAAASALKGPLAGVNQALDKPSTTALGRVGSAFDNVAARARGGLASISAWLPALGALGAAGSLGGLVAMTRRAAEGYDGLSTSAQKLGLAGRDLAVFRYGAKLVNVESEALEKGLMKLNLTMYNAATGKNKDVAALFQRMGIALRDSGGHVKNAGNSLEDIAEAFKNTGNPATRTAMAVALFGRAGADLLPFLVKGRAGIADLREEMRRFSGLTDEHRAGFEKLDRAYKDLDKAGSGLSSRLGAVLAPIMLRVVNFTTDWIVANRELLAQSLERKFASLSRAFDKVAAGISAIIAIPFVADLMKSVQASDVFDVALAVLGATMVGPLFAAVQMIIGAVWSMNAAMLANPFVAFAVGVAAVSYAIYANWGAITAWFREQMLAIADAFDRGFGSGLLEIFWRFNPFRVLNQAVSGLVKWLFDIDLFDAGARLFRRLIDGIMSMLPDFRALWSSIINGTYFTGPAAPASPAFSGAGLGMPDYSSPNGLMMPSAPAPGSAGANPQNTMAQRIAGEIRVVFQNPPPGTSAEAASSGGVSLNTNVGRSMEVY